MAAVCKVIRHSAVRIGDWPPGMERNALFLLNLFGNYGRKLACKVSRHAADITGPSRGVINSIEKPLFFGRTRPEFLEIGGRAAQPTTRLGGAMCLNAIAEPAVAPESDREGLRARRTVIPRGTADSRMAVQAGVRISPAKLVRSPLVASNLVQRRWITDIAWRFQDDGRKPAPYGKSPKLSRARRPLRMRGADRAWPSRKNTSP